MQIKMPSSNRITASDFQPCLCSAPGTLDGIWAGSGCRSFIPRDCFPHNPGQKGTECSNEVKFNRVKLLNTAVPTHQTFEMPVDECQMYFVDLDREYPNPSNQELQVATLSNETRDA